MSKQLGRSVTDITIRMRDFKVPYQMKKISVRPVLMGLADSIVATGDVSILGLGRFYVYRRRVSKAIGSREKVMKLCVAFKPFKSFLKKVEEKWNQPLEVTLAPSSLEPAPSAAGEGSLESSAGREGARGVSSLTGPSGS